MLPCKPAPAGNDEACAASQHSVFLVQRPDGRVLSLSSEPGAPAAKYPLGDLRIVDVTDPSAPRQVGADPAQREIAHFAPPDRTDPQGTFPAKATVVGVAMLDSGGRQYVVITDVNSGLYVLATPRAKR